RSDATTHALHSFPTRRSSDLGEDPLRVAARVVDQVVEEVLAGQEDGALLVERLDPGRAVEGDHALPHVLLRDARQRRVVDGGRLDRKSTRLNSSHQIISYAVF